MFDPWSMLRSGSEQQPCTVSAQPRTNRTLRGRCRDRPREMVRGVLFALARLGSTMQTTENTSFSGCEMIRVRREKPRDRVQSHPVGVRLAPDACAACETHLLVFKTRSCACRS